MWLPWGFYAGNAICYQEKTCQSTCLKVIPHSRTNTTKFISDQWCFAAHVNLSTLNLTLFISVLHSYNHSSRVALFNQLPSVSGNWAHGLTRFHNCCSKHYTHLYSCNMRWYIIYIFFHMQTPQDLYRTSGVSQLTWTWAPSIYRCLFQSAVLQGLSLPQIRDICQSNGLSVTGNQATLNKRLEDAGIASEDLEERRNAPNVPPQQTNDTLARTRRQQNHTFSEEQMDHINCLVSIATREIGSEAARAAFKATRAQQSPSFTASDAFLPLNSPQ